MRSASLSKGKSFGFLGPMHLRSASSRRRLTSTAQFQTLPALNRLPGFLFVSTKKRIQQGTSMYYVWPTFVGGTGGFCCSFAFAAASRSSRCASHLDFF